MGKDVLMKIDNAIFNKMGDNISKKLYADRVMYNNGKIDVIEDITCSSREILEFIQFMDENKDNLYIFSAGILGQLLATSWGWKYQFKAFIDNNEAICGEILKNIPVIQLKELVGEKKDSAAIIIMNKFCYQEILEQLINNGFKENHIFNFGKLYGCLNKKQYFDLEYMKVGNSERFIDCGALDGETSLNLLELCGGELDKIWMFEPDKNNVKKIKKNFEKRNVNYEIIEKGVWSCQTKLRFNSFGNSYACIDENGYDVIETVRLDDIVADKKPTFIKMDIEGAELEALLGAECVIREFHPKLAIAIYHKPEDVFEIPELIMKFNQEYQFYLRHYSFADSETVLYAI